MEEKLRELDLDLSSRIAVLVFEVTLLDDLKNRDKKVYGYFLLDLIKSMASDLARINRLLEERQDLLS